MSTVDLSRQLTDRRKNYRGMRAQQGRLLSDSDINEASILEEEELRRTRLHAIGAYGAPGQGFLPTGFAVGAGGKLDFTLSPGELYLGGLRLEMSAAEKFLEQKDWLSFDPATDAAGRPANGTTRTDLVWIEAWQQPVTATEDRELFEPALGGPDTSTAWRTMRRVHLLPGVNVQTCAEAWAAARASFTPLGTINDEFELATAATLTVLFTAPSGVGDLCAPAQPGGYAGAENQAIRVQMVDAGHYTWGYDNAAPLYRATVSAKGANMVRLTLLDRPKDAAHWPLKGQTVEVKTWGAALSNGQRVAEISGHLCKVDRSYDPNDGTLEIDVPLPTGFARWQARSDKAQFFDGTPQEDFVYVTFWNRGDDLASPAAIPVASNMLGNTGLRIVFNGGPRRPGDHWIIAARPTRRDRVTPWRLGLPAGAPPHGVKRYRAPIGLIEWRTDGAGATTGRLVHDCRPPFLPLTRLRNCCNVTVGDGTESYGMFTSIQAAVDALPPAGGTVCILPGLYRESVRLLARRNVTLHGCGPRSRIAAPAQNGPSSTAVHILRSADVCVEGLALEGGGEAVVRVEESETVRIASCLVQHRDSSQLASAWTAMFIDGRGIEVADNIVEPLPADLNRIFHRPAAAQRGADALAARGGIQLAGGCERVRISGNVIVGGTGNGITLGNIVTVDERTEVRTRIPDIDDGNPCAPCDPTNQATPRRSPRNRVRYESGGDLYEIVIDDNVILRHGANGIAVVRFFGPDEDALALVTVHGLTITRNLIAQCLRREIAVPRSEMLLFLGYGGIALAFATELEIDANVIVRNGRDWLSPVCGIFMLAADGLRIEHNLIRLNGPPGGGEKTDQARPGIRAGVHVWLAISLEAGSGEPDESGLVAARRSRAGTDQVRVHGNQIEQPLGRALFLLGAGAMHVCDNRLVSEGAGPPGTDPVAATVLVANFGIGREWTIGLLQVLLELLGRRPSPQKICADAREAAGSPGFWARWPTGKLAFNDNQVSFLMEMSPPGMDISSALLLSVDDIGACDNQFEYHTRRNRTVFADLIALAPTLRTNDNRLAETWGRATSSILSSGLLNTAADNQSTHCLRILGRRRAEHDNLVLAELFCANACSDRITVIRNAAIAADTTSQS